MALRLWCSQKGRELLGPGLGETRDLLRQDYMGENSVGAKDGLPVLWEKVLIWSDLGIFIWNLKTKGKSSLLVLAF